MNVKTIKNHFFNTIKQNFWFFALFVVATAVAALNYNPNTHLTGWDTLHPEFNYIEYTKRVLNSAWQEHQGLGSTASQAHASELPRLLILLLLDVFFKTHNIRFLYALLMLVIGPLGVFLFTTEVFFYQKNSNSNLKKSDLVKGISGFLAGMFYLFNLATLQHFYVPLEMFLTYFGFLGFVMWLTLRYLRSTKPKSNINNLILYTAITFLASPQAHTPTLFYAFLLCYGAFLFIFALTNIKNKNFVSVFKKCLVLLVVTLVVNLYWLLPNVYYVFEHGDEIQRSKIHFLFSQEAFVQNVQYGNIQNIALFKSFLFNWGEHIGFKQFGPLLNEWIAHQNNIAVLALGYLYFGLGVLGLLIGILKKNKVIWSLSMFTLVSLFFLLNVNPPFGFIYTKLVGVVPLFEEAFRFAFTKFSIILVFSLAASFGYLFGTLFTHLSRFDFRHSARILQISTLIIASSFVFYMFPAFNGNLISKSMKVKIPDRYFELFEYVNKDDSFGRVANFPIHTIWGWVYHDWDPQTNLGYQGAGFLWFGFEKPLLDREFDRWNIINENYYNEMSYAVYSQDVELFDLLLKKYNVSWVFLDKSVITIDNPESLLFIDELEKMFLLSNKIELKKDFGDGLVLYKNVSDDFSEVEVLTEFSVTSDATTKQWIDANYKKYGNYVNYGDPRFVFSDLFNVNDSLKSSFIYSDENFIIFKSPLEFRSLSNINYDAFYPFELVINAQNQLVLEPINGFFAQTAYPTQINLDQEITDSQNFVIAVGTNFVELSDVIDNKNNIVQLNPTQNTQIGLYKREQDNELISLAVSGVLESCGDLGSKATYSYFIENNVLYLESKNAAACVTVPLNQIPEFSDNSNDLEGLGLVRFYYSTVEGEQASSFCLLDATSGLCLNREGTTQNFLVDLSEKDINTLFLRLRVKQPSQLWHDSAATRVGYSSVGFNNYSFQSETTFVVSNENLGGDKNYIPEIKVAKVEANSGNVKELSNNPRLCNGKRFTEQSYVNNFPAYTRYVSEGDFVCDSIHFSTLSHSQGHVLEIKSRNLEGLPLRVCLTNETTKRCDLRVQLGTNSDFETEYFLIPPLDDGIGYTLNLNNPSFAGSLSINDVSYVSISTFSYDLITSFEYVYDDDDNKLDAKYDLVVLNQAYDRGWVAWCGVKRCDFTHVKANNWANGWLVPKGTITDNSQFVVFFWPQLLQYFGHVLFLTLVILIVKKHIKSSLPHSVDKSQTIR